MKLRAIKLRAILVALEAVLWLLDRIRPRRCMYPGCDNPNEDNWHYHCWEHAPMSSTE